MQVGKKNQSEELNVVYVKYNLKFVLTWIELELSFLNGLNETTHTHCLYFVT